MTTITDTHVISGSSHCPIVHRAGNYVVCRGGGGDRDHACIDVRDPHRWRWNALDDAVADADRLARIHRWGPGLQTHQRSATAETAAGIPS